MSNELTHDEKLTKIRDLVSGIDIGMMTTLNDDGTFHSRPMSVNGNVEFDGDLWFFTYGDSPKVHQIERDARVNVAFSDPKNQTYVSLSGTAHLVRDKAKIEALWKPELNAWFPQGTETPDVALLKVEVEGAEYWDSPTNPVAHVIGFLKTKATGETQQVGENEKVAL